MSIDLPDILFRNNPDSNDGNTARRAFKNHEVFSEFTQVNFDIIKSLHKILTDIFCGYPFNINE